MQQTAQKLTIAVTKEQRRGKTKQNKTTGPGKLLHTFTNSHAADASAATRRAQNADNAELALQ
jgi:hypothetical protein